MRLLIATPEYPPHSGGIAKFTSTLAPALVRAGCRVRVLVANPFCDDFPSYELDGVDVSCVPQRDIRDRADQMPQLSAAPRFRQWVAAARAAHDAATDLEADWIETADFGLSFVPFLLAPSSVPVVVQCQGSIGQISEHEPRRADLELDLALARLTEAVILPFATELQTYGAANAAEWTARLARPVRYIPPPLLVDAAAADPQPGSAALVVGRIQPWKGPETLCRALQLLNVTPPITWIGRDTDTAPGGASFDRYLATNYSEVWGPRITAIGHQRSVEVAAFYRHARFVIVPSEWDVFNLAAAEAMAAGCVVICSDGAGASVLIESGRNGFTFRAGDPDALADAISRVMALSSRAAADMRHQARQTVIRMLNPDAIAATHIETLRKLEPVNSARPPDWVRDFLTGHETDRVSPAFLDQISMRELSKYLGRRAGETLLSRVMSRSSTGSA